MMSALTIPIVPKPLDTLGEVSAAIDEKGLPVESYDCIFAGLAVGSDPVWDRIMENCGSASYAEDEVEAFGRLHNEDILGRFESAEFLEFKKRQHFLTSFGEPLAHIVSEPVRTFYVAFGMQKDSPFTAKFSATFTR